MCDLECYEGYFFTVEDDPTPQICIDGTWSYQRLDMPFPTCEGAVLSICCILTHIYYLCIYCFSGKFQGE